MQVGRANFCTLLLAGVYRSIIISRKLQLSRITSASENIHTKKIILTNRTFQIDLWKIVPVHITPAVEKKSRLKNADTWIL